MDSEKAPLLPTSSAEASPSNGNADHQQTPRRNWFLLLITGFCIWAILSQDDDADATKHKKKKKHVDVCTTPECIHASSEFLYNLSPKYKELDPCNNFEEMVCGGWRERHDLRPDQGDMFTGTLMAEASKSLLRHILEAPYPEKSKHSSFSPADLVTVKKSTDEANFDKLRTAYDACMDESKIKEAGLAPLEKYVEMIQHIDYPDEMRNVSGEDKSAIRQTLLFLQHAGVDALVSAGTGADDTNPDSVVVSISAPYRIGLPSKERYEDPKLFAEYSVVVRDVLSGVIPDQDPDFFGPVAAFEKQLAAISPATEERESVEFYYNPMSLDKAQELIPLVEIKEIIKTLAPKDVHVDRIIVGAPKYLKDLNEILAGTPIPVLRNYFIWKLVQSFASYVDAPAVTPLKRFNNELAGKAPDSAPERWRTCVSHVDEGLGWILSRFFVEKAFSAKAKKFGDEMVTDIKTEFAKTLQHIDWMDAEVKKLAIQKVHNIVQKIGYPTTSPDIMDPAVLQKYYASVEITEEQFLGNELNMRTAAVNEEWSALGKPVDREKWDMTSSTVNAYYNPPGNEIVFPAGIMQSPVFYESAPEYLSYGAFASVAGHELSHAFDSTGRHYDQNGNLTDWWTNSTVKAFKEKADCFVKQYSNYTIEGPDGKTLHVNGRLTLGENIADAGGVSAAFSAWKKRAHKSPNQDLPGLEHFTQEQLFFVSYGTWWCGKSRPASAVNRIYTDPHAPVWARILGTMANSKDFLESFQCKAKEPVCKLW